MGFRREPTSPGMRAVVHSNGVLPEPVPAPTPEPTGVSWWDRLPPAVRIGAYMLLGGGIPTGLMSLIPFEPRETHATDIKELKEADLKLQAQIDALNANVSAIPAATVKQLLEQTTIKPKKKVR